jgi:ppGpp synthetase/RelA/SpoT-type nucleotidyltranferase
MGLPISRSAFNRLGERLAASDDISAEDDALLERCLGAYDEVKEVVRRRLGELGYAATARTKTTGTLVDKLRRETGAKLANVQDVAGCRITVDGTRLDQDAVVARIVEAFGGGDREPKVIDRRERPSAGYRAVHVVVFVDGLPVEIQVRTQLQNLWAQLTEQLGDLWGRAIRYGGAPDDPDAEAWGGETRRDVVAEVVELAEFIEAQESGTLDVMAMEEQVDELSAEVRTLHEARKSNLRALEQSIRVSLHILDRLFQRLG